MTLPAYLYRNPETVLIEAENRTCAGCRHGQTMTFGDGEKRETVYFCAAGKRYGRRCKHYEEAE